jgi:hypothetical protein
VSSIAPLHRDAAQQRWQTLTLMEQLAHVGSEVERAIRAHEAKNFERFNGALGRALELFDFSATDKRWTAATRREILRAREEFCRLFFDEKVPSNSARGLRRYFLAFAIAARRP